MRDDVLLIWEDEKNEAEDDDLEKFVSKVNKIQPRIQFTIEREKEKSIPFLDIRISRTGTRLKTSVYRKSTHAQKYLHWKSNHPKLCKLGVLKSLINTSSAYTL